MRNRKFESYKDHNKSLNSFVNIMLISSLFPAECQISFDNFIDHIEASREAELYQNEEIRHYGRYYDGDEGVVQLEYAQHFDLQGLRL